MGILYQDITDVSNDSYFEDKWFEIVLKIEKYSLEHFIRLQIQSLS
jgi:hypothetical protein